MQGNDRPKNGQEWIDSVNRRLAELDTRTRAAGRVIASGSTVMTTDGSGRASFLFGRTFGSPPTVVVSGGNNEQAAVYQNTITTTGFTAIFTQADGTPLASIAVRLNWIATPPTT